MYDILFVHFRSGSSSPGDTSYIYIYVCVCENVHVGVCACVQERTALTAGFWQPVLRKMENRLNNLFPFVRVRRRKRKSLRVLDGGGSGGGLGKLFPL